MELLAWHGALVVNTSMGVKRKYTPAQLLGKSKRFKSKTEFEMDAKNRRRTHIERLLEDPDYKA